MKNLFLNLIMFFLLVTTISAQVQQGYIRTINRPDRQPQPVPDVLVNIGGLTNNVRTDAQGQFAFPVTGQSYRFMRIQKQGYQLIDKGVVGRQYPFSSSVRQEIVMVSLADLEADKRRIEERAYQRAQSDYNRRLAEIQQQLEAQLITQQEAAQQELTLGDNFQKFIEMIGDMAERYATMDYEGITDLNRQILQCIENAELERADSLINSKGSTQQREEELQQSRELAEAAQQLSQQAQRDYQFKLQDLAEDYYNKYTIFASNYQTDSAAYYLERRAALDTTNVEWQNHVGRFLDEIIADYDLAKTYYQRVLNQSIIQFGEQAMWTSTSYNNIAGIYDTQGNYELALEYYQRALEVERNIHGENHSGMALLYNNIGSTCNHRYDFELALEYLQKALEIWKVEFGEMHPNVATCYDNIGYSYWNLRNYSQASDYIWKALQIRLSLYGENHPYVATSYNNIGGVYDVQGDYFHALDYYQKALEIRVFVLGDQHPDVAISYNNIGFVYHIKGDYIRALEYYHKALEIRKNILGEQHEKTIQVLRNIEIAKYNQAQSDGSLSDYLADKVFFALVIDGNTPACQQGMLGEYILLEFADWTQDSTKSLFTKNDELRGHPKDIVVMKDGVITQHHFENVIGAQLGIRQISKDERLRINEAYDNWKRENGR